ncbi:MAG: hypothetical protein MUC38_10495, partial [Cyclobacteriaceae bacterium]|nr:hypothetical protein [Cyclobacteriaceae bacterium]
MVTLPELPKTTFAPLLSTPLARAVQGEACETGCGNKRTEASPCPQGQNLLTRTVSIGISLFSVPPCRKVQKPVQKLLVIQAPVVVQV